MTLAPLSTYQQETHKQHLYCCRFPCSRGWLDHWFFSRPKFYGQWPLLCRTFLIPSYKMHGYVGDEFWPWNDRGSIFYQLIWKYYFGGPILVKLVEWLDHSIPVQRGLRLRPASDLSYNVWGENLPVLLDSRQNVSQGVWSDKEKWPGSHQLTPFGSDKYQARSWCVVLCFWYLLLLLKWLAREMGIIAKNNF